MSESASLQLKTGLDVAVSLPLASVGSRAAAYIFDMLVLCLGWLLVAMGLVLAKPGELPSPRILAMFGAGWLLSQFVMFVSQEVLMSGQTLGKRFMGIRVVSADGTPPDMGRVLLRNLLRPVDNLPYGFSLGVALVVFTAGGRRLGDLAAGTFVVHDLPAPAPLPDLLLPTDATPEEIALVERWFAAAPALHPDAHRAVSKRLAAWVDQRWPNHLPSSGTPAERIAIGFAVDAGPE